MKFDWLRQRAGNIYSQFGEDGILDAIFEKIGVQNTWCFECGAADGLFFSNTRRLVELGWDAVLVEADEQCFRRLEANCGTYPNARCIHAKIDKDLTIDDVLDGVGAPPDIDLVSIDVDGQDFYLFNAIFRHQPRVVIIEYSRKHEEHFIPPIDGEGQAGWAAIADLALGRYYLPVCRTNTNMILVRQPLEGLLEC